MKHSHQVLVVDDDAATASLLCSYLARFGFAAHTAADGPAMRRQLARLRIDLIVLDLQLPGEDGLALVQEVRAASSTPIIMLTARAHACDRVVGLEMGADDYMAKPFEPRELVARIHAVLRRAAAPQDASAEDVAAPFTDVVRFDGWQLRRSQRCLTSPRGMVVPLSNTEYQLLSRFLEAPDRVISRDQLGGRTMRGFERSVDLQVSRLRQKLVDADSSSMIKTVRGEGYVFNARVAPGQRLAARPTPAADTASRAGSS